MDLPPSEEARHLGKGQGRGTRFQISDVEQQHQAGFLTSCQL
jgi:hypothetical protein